MSPEINESSKTSSIDPGLHSALHHTVDSHSRATGNMPQTCKTYKAKAIKIIEDHERHRVSQTRQGMRLPHETDPTFQTPTKNLGHLAQAMRPATVQWPQKDFDDGVSNDPSLTEASPMPPGLHIDTAAALRQGDRMRVTRDSCMTDPEARAVPPPSAAFTTSPTRERPDERGSSQVQGFTQNRLKRLEELANRTAPLTAFGGARSMSKATNKTSASGLT